jgi:hypothetical protein
VCKQPPQLALAGRPGQPGICVRACRHGSWATRPHCFAGFVGRRLNTCRSLLLSDPFIHACGLSEIIYMDSLWPRFFFFCSLEELESLPNLVVDREAKLLPTSIDQVHKTSPTKLSTQPHGFPKPYHWWRGGTSRL